MFLRLTSLISLLFIQSLWASSERDLLQLLEEINSSRENLQCLENDQRQQCVLDLCGHPSINPLHTFTNGSFKDLNAQTLIPNFPALKSDLESILRNQSQQIQEKLKSLVSRSPEEIYQLSPGEWDELAALLYLPRLFISVDQTKELKDRITVTINDSTHLKDEAFKLGLEEFAENYKQSIENDQLKGIELGLFTNDELKSLYEFHLKELKQEYQLLTSTSAQARYSQWVNADTEPQDLRYNLQNVIVVRKEISSILSEDSKKSSTESANFCNSVCRRGITARNLVNELKATLDDPDFLPNALNECLGRFAFYSEQSERRKEFKKLIPQVIRDFSSKVMKNVSAHSRQEFEKLLNEQYSFVFQDLPNPYEALDELKRSTGGSLVSESFSGIQDVAGFLTESGELNPFKTLPVCNGEILQITDSASSGEIEISPHSCFQSGMGKDVLAHEIAHVLSFTFNRGLLSTDSLQKYNEKRTCISEMNSGILRIDSKNRKFPGEHVLSEEDVADVLAHEASSTKNLSYCAFFPVDKSSGLYDESWIDKTGNGHSPSLLRLVREAYFKRDKLPASCQSLFNEHYESVSLKKCQ